MEYHFYWLDIWLSWLHVFIFPGIPIGPGAKGRVVRGAKGRVSPGAPKGNKVHRESQGHPRRNKVQRDDKGNIREFILVGPQIILALSLPFPSAFHPPPLALPIPYPPKISYKSQKSRIWLNQDRT